MPVHDNKNSIFDLNLYCLLYQCSAVYTYQQIYFRFAIITNSVEIEKIIALGQWHSLRKLAAIPQFFACDLTWESVWFVSSWEDHRHLQLDNDVDIHGGLGFPLHPPLLRHSLTRISLLSHANSKWSSRQYRRPQAVQCKSKLADPHNLEANWIKLINYHKFLLFTLRISIARFKVFGILFAPILPVYWVRTVIGVFEVTHEVFFKILMFSLPYEVVHWVMENCVVDFIWKMKAYDEKLIWLNITTRVIRQILKDNYWIVHTKKLKTSCLLVPGGGGRWRTQFKFLSIV